MGQRVSKEDNKTDENIYNDAVILLFGLETLAFVNKIRSVLKFANRNELHTEVIPEWGGFDDKGFILGPPGTISINCPPKSHAHEIQKKLLNKLLHEGIPIIRDQNIIEPLN